MRPPARSCSEGLRRKGAVPRAIGAAFEARGRSRCPRTAPRERGSSLWGNVWASRDEPAPSGPAGPRGSDSLSVSQCGRPAAAGAVPVAESAALPRTPACRSGSGCLGPSWAWKHPCRCRLRRPSPGGAPPPPSLRGAPRRAARLRLFKTPEYSVKQPPDPVVCKPPANGILCAPSASGKTALLVSMILEQYRGCFERIYIFSPSVEVDSAWQPVKDYIRDELGVNTDREQCWWEDWDEGALRKIIADQKRITQKSKELGLKKLYSVLVVLDDHADNPAVHRQDGRWRLGHPLHQGQTFLYKYLGKHPEIAAHELGRAGQCDVSIASSGCGISSSWTLWWRNSRPCCRRKPCTRCTKRPRESPTVSGSSICEPRRKTCFGCASTVSLC